MQTFYESFLNSPTWSQVARQTLADLPSYLQPTILIPVFVFLVAVLFLIFLCYLGFKYLLLRHKINQNYVLLEVKPVRTTERKPTATQELFNLIHSLGKRFPWWQRWLGVSKNYSFEIVSTKDHGIKYVVRVSQNDADHIKQSLTAYLPGLTVNEIDDYIPTDSNGTIQSFALSNHYAFPLKPQADLSVHDPMAYITGSMTKLQKGELMSMQMIVSPATHVRLSSAHQLAKHLLDNGWGTNNSDSQSVLRLSILLFSRLLFQVATLPVGLLVCGATGGREGPFLEFPGPSKDNATADLTKIEELVESKISHPLFRSSLRLLIVSNNQSEVRKRKDRFISSLSPFTNATYQSLKTQRTLNLEFTRKLQHFTYRHRLFNPFQNLILSTSEISDLYHFPFTSTTKTEDIQKQHTKQLPAPTSLKRADNLDITFAKNIYGGSSTDIGLSIEERRRHMYIIGATGTGKTTMLLSMINQDIQSGKGLAVIDPHGDLIENLLHLIPKDRVKDVVYFNPDDIGHPMGINLLELPPDLTGDEELRAKELIAESIISLFSKIYSDKYSGPRMEYILRNTIHTAFLVPGATLFTVYKLLINTTFRNQVIKKVTDENLLDFWKYEFAKAGDYQKVKMISPITNKIGRFLFSPTAKRILEQEKSTINFDSIMDEGKILLCNLSKGKIGEDNSEVFGVVMMAKIQLAALKRSRQTETNRRDFYLYVDEFQNFATPTFSQILSEARKYRLSAILAHQTTSQLENKSLINITLANTGTVICFRTANPEDERLLLPQFTPYVDKGEIASLPSFNFYMRLSALNPEEPFSGQTIPLHITENLQAYQAIIASSQEKYAIKYIEPEPQTKSKTQNKRATKSQSKSPKKATTKTSRRPKRSYK